jgi:Tol biopolymer transport system component
MPRHARRLLAAATLALLVAATLAGPASATLPGVNGRIVFMRFDENGLFQVWTANPDMTGQVQLTHGPDWDGWFPSWSPDHTRIAFSSSHDDPDRTGDPEIHDVYTMNADGSDVRKITDSHGYNGKPSWSPDGQWLLFDADRGDYPASQGIYIIRSDGSGGLRRITTLPVDASWQELARFSPDGSRIVFDQGQGGHLLRNHQDGRLVAEQAALFTVRPDGSDLRQITPWGLHAADADWSPDGQHLVFSGQPTHLGNIGDVLISDADGSHVTDLTQDHGITGIGRDSAVDYSESFNPAWSPDGTTIVFVHAQFTAVDGFHMGLQVMRPDGSGRHWLSEGEEHQPDWGSAPPLP